MCKNHPPIIIFAVIIFKLEPTTWVSHYELLFLIQPKKKVSESSTQRHASAPSLTSLESSSTLLPPTNCRKAQKEASQHSASNLSRPRKLVTLQDSPLTQQKFKNRPLASHSTPLEPIPPSVNPPKQTMLVQWFCIWCYEILWSLLSSLKD